MRRMWVWAATLVVASFCANPAGWAQQYPQRPITVVVPYAAGGPTDVAMRIAANRMSVTLGQQIVIENVAGAGG
jgi:tripartite-type tricarboxylate transporter receptor subunit TctC